MELFRDNSTAPDHSQSGERLDVTLVAVTFHNAESTFLVGRFQSADGEVFTATGEMFAPHVGDSYTLVGGWTVHPKWGRQFRWSSYEVQYPNTAAGIERYLASGLIPGLGPGTARSIVRTFGVATIDVMNDDIGRLTQVPGIGARKLEAISRAWEHQRSVQNVMLFLKSHGISTAYAVRIHRTYGSDSIARISADPYSMIEDVEGIGFVIADRIARGMGMAVDDPRRLRAGILHVLQEAARSGGHVYLERGELLDAACGVLESPPEAVASALVDAEQWATVVIENDRVHAPQLHAAECITTEFLTRLLRRPPELTVDPAQSARIAAAEDAMGVEFSPHQAEAISRCFAAPVVIITGGPGTGKTTAVAGILALAQDREWTAAVCAPTGRAAKRLTEVTGHPASTIHRLLEFDPVAWCFRRDEDNPLDARIVIVDEVSMIDIQLMASLVRAVGRDAHLVLVGDPDQLPSVGPGNVLHDLITSECIEVIALRQIFRQEETSSIVVNAHRVRQGLTPNFGGETLLVEAATGEAIVERISQLVTGDLFWGRPFDPLRDIQVLSPMHNTLAGVRHLNTVLQRLLNRDGRTVLQRNDQVWRSGDKVMQIRNDYEKDVFNGDIGFILGRTEADDGIVIDFDGREVVVSFEEMDAVVHAYAITIHKSQGSEYRAVIVPVTMQHRIMLQRNLLYTAMTRARTLLVFVGQKHALAQAINNNRVVDRRSGLCERLHGVFR